MKPASPQRTRAAMSGDMLSAFRWLALPVFIEQLVLVLAGMVNTSLISKLGEAQVAVVSLIDALNYLPNYLFASLATGGMVLISRLIGRQEHDKVAAASSQLMAMSVLFGVFMSALFLLGNNFILNLLYGSLDAQAMHSARLYFMVTTAAYPFLAITASAAGLFRSRGMSRLSMVGSIIIYAAIMLFNYILLHLLGLSVTAAGASFLTANALGAAFYVFFLLRKKQPAVLGSLKSFRFERHTTREILRVAVPVGLENTAFQAAIVVISSLYAGYGTEATAANAVAGSIGAFASLVGEVMIIVMMIMVGRAAGAADLKAARTQVKHILLVSYVCMLAVNGAILLFMHPLLNLFNLSGGARQLAQYILYFYVAGCALVWVPAFVLPAALKAGGDAKFCLLVSTIAIWGCRVGAGFVLGNILGWGVLGIWCGVLLDWLLRAVVFSVRYKGERWFR